MLDRGYCDYDLLRHILQAQSSFVVRLRSNAKYKRLEDRPVSLEAKEAGVQWDRIVKLGCHACTQVQDRRLRLVRIHAPDPPRIPGQARRNRVDRKTKAYRTDSGERELLLVTDLLDLDVELIGLLYRQRWQIELFFRWFRQILEADYLLSQSQNGMTIVTYCALIASLLITLWTGRKPTKRTYELLCFYFLGWVEEEALVAHVGRLQLAKA